MGQYYRIAYTKDHADLAIHVPRIKGLGFMGNKLCEHSCFGEPVPNAIANIMYKNPIELIWCGDYADDDEVENLTGATREEIFDLNAAEFDKYQFNYTGKFFVNHDKKLYISFDEYIANAQDMRDIYCPIVMLTCIGNGLGDGDYSGNNTEYIGTWAMDTVSIEAEVPAGYKKFDVMFNEEF